LRQGDRSIIKEQPHAHHGAGLVGSAIIKNLATEVDFVVTVVDINKDKACFAGLPADYGQRGISLSETRTSS
jgi:hypothetical protein